MVKTTGTVTDWSSEYKKDVEKMMRFFEQKSPDDIIRGMIVWDSVPKIMKPDVINSFYARDVSSSSLIGFGSFGFYPKIAAMKLLKISKTTIDPIGFLGFSILLTSEIEKECKFYKESKTGFFFKSRLIKNINNILKIFPEEVALNFIETFVDKDEHILLRSKIKSLVDSFEQQLIYKNNQASYSLFFDLNGENFKILDTSTIYEVYGNPYEGDFEQYPFIAKESEVMILKDLEAFKTSLLNKDTLPFFSNLMKYLSKYILRDYQGYQLDDKMFESVIQNDPESFKTLVRMEFDKIIKRNFELMLLNDGYKPTHEICYDGYVPAYPELYQELKDHRMIQKGFIP